MSDCGEPNIFQLRWICKAHVSYSTFHVKFDGKFVVFNADQYKYMKRISIHSIKTKDPFDKDQWMRKGHDIFW